MYNWNQFKNITAITTTRDGGFSTGNFSSANLAYHVGDDKETVKKNRDAIFSKVGINEQNSVFVAQFHSDITYKVTSKDKGRGFNAFEDGIIADALYTSEKGINLAVYHANCVPVFIYVPTHNIVGVIHAGEEGSLKDITGKFIKQLIENEKVDPKHIFAHLGPSLSFAHRLISKEKADKLASNGGITQKAVKGTHPQYFLDLPLLNILTLRENGVPFDNITFTTECTHENNDRYFSASSKEATGRNISFIRLDN